jgi:thiol-disulfide isomerase/thioredoxin
MKFVRCLSALLSVLLFSGCVTPAEHPLPVAVGPPIDAPAALAGAMLSLTISDLHGFLDGTGAAMSQIYPMLGGPMLKTLLGSRLGDPELAGFAQGGGLAVVLLNPTNGFAVAEVDPAQSASTIQSLQSLGLMAKQQGGLLLAAKNEEQLASAERLAASVQATLLDARREPSLRISLKPSALINANEESIAAGLRQMMATMEKAAVSNRVMDVQRMLEMELQVFLSLCRQIEAVETTVKPVGGAIHLAKTLQPVAGSRLAAYCDAPALHDYNPRLQAGMLPDGVIQLEFCMRNPGALVEFVRGEAAALAGVTEVEPALADRWVQTLARWTAAMGPTVCESVLTEGGRPAGFAFLADVNDEEALLEAFRNVSVDLDSMGFLRLYKSLGMPLSAEFEENVRDVDGVPVHRLKMNFSLANIPVEQRAAMESMMNDLSLAIYKDVLIYASDDATVEKVLERIKSGAMPGSPLAARAAFPAGGIYYADFDVGGYLRFIASFAKDAPAAPAMLEKLAAVLDGAEPIVMSGYRNSGRMTFRSQLPVGLLVRLAQAGQLIALDKMRKNGADEVGQAEPQAPVPAPDATLNLLDGAAVQISGFAGRKVVVLDFWASWCGPCRKGLPMVQTVADYFTGRDVVFFAVNLGESAETARGFFADNGLTLPVALDDGALSEAFGVSGIPHTVIIGRDGNIQSVHTGAADDLDAQLTAEINTSLAE